MIETTRRKVLSGEQVRVNSQPVRVGGTVAKPTERCLSGETSVREIRNAAGHISEVHIHCECGSVAVLQCDYES